MTGPIALRHVDSYSSFVPSYKVPTGSMPTEVETDMFCECKIAACIGPHHRGKKRSS